MELFKTQNEWRPLQFHLINMNRTAPLRLICTHARGSLVHSGKQSNQYIKNNKEGTKSTTLDIF